MNKKMSKNYYQVELLKLPHIYKFKKSKEIK